MTVRVAFFAPYLMTGGTQRHLQGLLRGLDPDRFSVVVYTLRAGGEVADELLAVGIDVRPLPMGRGLLSVRSLGAILHAARRLRAEGVDVVHGYQWRPALIGALAGRLARVPLVLASKRSLTASDRTARYAWRWIGRLVDTIVVNAEALRDEAVADGVRTRWVVLRNGIDVARFQEIAGRSEAKSALGLDPTRPVIGAIGRLETRKGHDRLLQALRDLAVGANGSTPQLLLVGDGPLRGRLEALARELGVDTAVRFTGSLVDVRPALAAMDIFVLPSREEGMSNALLEAMAAGRPVVATNVGGNGEIVDEGRTGILVRPDDGSALAAALHGLLSDHATAERLATAGREEASRRYDVRTMVDRMEAFYHERLNAVGGACS